MTLARRYKIRPVHADLSPFGREALAALDLIVAGVTVDRVESETLDILEEIEPPGRGRSSGARRDRGRPCGAHRRRRKRMSLQPTRRRLARGSGRQARWTRCAPWNEARRDVAPGTRPRADASTLHGVRLRDVHQQRTGAPRRRAPERPAGAHRRLGFEERRPTTSAAGRTAMPGDDVGRGDARMGPGAVRLRLEQPTQRQADRRHTTKCHIRASGLPSPSEPASQSA